MRLQVVYLPADKYLIVFDEVDEDATEWIQTCGADMAEKLGAVQLIAVPTRLDVVQ